MSPLAVRKTRGYKASLFLAKVIDELYPELREANLSQIVARLSPARHSDDFRSARWFGTTYTFTPSQAVIVRELWKHWKRGTPRVGAAALLEAADMISDRISELFKRSPAWGEMIRTDGGGGYWLEKPVA